MGKKILIIDDDPNLCRFLEEALRMKGHHVTSVTHPDAGLQALAGGNWDLLLMDILLPGRSGLEICRTLRRSPPTRRLPVLLMTALYQEAARVRETRQNFGATDILFKPFTITALTRKVEEVLGLLPSELDETQRLRVQGSLVETPFPQLLHNLYTLRATGLLHLERGEVKKVIYTREGYPIFARSNLLRECLGQMLVRQRRISQEECTESLRRARDTGRMQGTVLMEMELLTPQQLHHALKEQVTEKLLEVFAWPEGTYRFLQARNFKKGITTIDLSPSNLILQGIRRHYPPHRTAQILLPHRHSYLIQAQNPVYRFQDLDLTPRETQVLSLCRGDLTLSEILDRHPLSRQAVEKLLAALLVGGLIEPRKTANSTQEDESVDLPETGDTRKVRERFLADYGRLMQLDYFTLLGTSPQGSSLDLRRGYFSLIKKYHPDRFLNSGLSPDMEQKVNELFRRINEAHEVLADADRRSKYLARNGEDSPMGPQVADVLQAETAFQKGMVLFRMNNYSGALELFREAVRLNPEEPEYLAYSAWSLHKSDTADPQRRVRARDTLQRAIHLNPRLDVGHFYLGLLLRAEGREKEAEKQFERAIQCNPNCTGALRELRLSNLRREKSQHRGVLGRVFRK